MKRDFTVTVEERPEGGVRIYAPGTGIVLSSANVAGAFEDLGTALREIWAITEAGRKALGE